MYVCRVNLKFRENYTFYKKSFYIERSLHKVALPVDKFVFCEIGIYAYLFNFYIAQMMRLYITETAC